MTDRMVRVGNADFRISAIVLFTRKLECDDARDICLESQNLQAEHELDMIGKFSGNAHWPFDIGRPGIDCRLLGALDLSLDFTNTVEILVHTRAIGGAHALPEFRN